MRRTVRHLTIAALLLLPGCALYEARHGDEPIERVEPRGPVRLSTAKIAAVGDLLLHESVKLSAEQVRLADTRSPHDGYGALFEDARPELAGSDLVFANLETPIAPRSDRGSGSFVFNAPIALLDALKDLGVGIVSFANNHVYDQRRSGFVETLEHLEAAELPFVGAGRSCAEARAARHVEVKGIPLAFLGATRLFNDNRNRGPDAPCASEFDEAAVLREVAAARAEGAALVVFSIHWGVEYETKPRREDVALAHRLLEGGVDVILGHHPHVLQPIEVYETRDGRTTLVAYSLGNFISNQSRTYRFGLHPDQMGNTRDGAVLHFSVVRKRYGAAERIELADVHVQTVWTDNNALEVARDPSSATVIRVRGVDRALGRLREALTSAREPGAQLRLRKRLELLEARRRIAGAVLGDDFLR